MKRALLVWLASVVMAGLKEPFAEKLFQDIYSEYPSQLYYFLFEKWAHVGSWAC